MEKTAPRMSTGRKSRGRPTPPALRAVSSMSAARRPKASKMATSRLMGMVMAKVAGRM